jgi:hypothetical protein
MTQYTIDIGAAPDDGQGDPLRTAFDYTNLNFDQIFASGPVLSNVVIANNTIRTINSNGNLILAPNGIGQIQLSAVTVPALDNVYDLGSPSQRFNSIYIGTGGLNISGPLSFGNVTVNNISSTGFMSAAGNITGANLQATGNIYIGNTVFTRTLTVGTRTTPVTVPLASNNTFDVGLRGGGNVVVYTT